MTHIKLTTDVYGYIVVHSDAIDTGFRRLAQLEIQDGNLHMYWLTGKEEIIPMPKSAKIEVQLTVINPTEAD